MFLLARSISPYTGCDQLLGVFLSEDAAEHARHTYISCIRSGAAVDPFATQAHWKRSLEDDVKLVSDIPVFKVSPQASAVYVVSFFEEFLGQVIRRFEAICGAEDEAARIAAEVEAKEDTFPCYTDIDHVRVDQLFLNTRVA